MAKTRPVGRGLQRLFGESRANCPVCALH